RDNATHSEAILFYGGWRMGPLPEGADTGRAEEVLSPGLDVWIPQRELRHAGARTGIFYTAHVGLIYTQADRRFTSDQQGTTNGADTRPQGAESAPQRRGLSALLGKTLIGGAPTGHDGLMVALGRRTSPLLFGASRTPGSPKSLKKRDDTPDVS